MITILLSLTLVVLLVIVSYIDWRTYRLPDKLTLPLIGLGLLASWIQQSNILLHGLGALVGYLVFVGIEKAYRHFRHRDGLGRGDAKLLAAGGAWCGVLALPMIILIASTTGLLVLLILRLSGHQWSNSKPVPFGPFLSLAILIVWGIQILNGQNLI